MEPFMPLMLVGSRLFSDVHRPGEHRPPPSQNGLSPPICRALRDGPLPLQPATTAGSKCGGSAITGSLTRTGRPSSTKSVMEGPACGTQ